MELEYSDKNSKRSKLYIAVGLIMARNGVGADDAFSRLHAAAQGVHQQLHAVVDAIIAGRLEL